MHTRKDDEFVEYFLERVAAGDRYSDYASCNAFATWFEARALARTILELRKKLWDKAADDVLASVLPKPADEGPWETPAWMTAPGSPWDELEASIETKKAVARVLYTDTDAVGALMPDGTVLDQWDERLRSAGGSPIFQKRKPMITETFEPIRPLRAPDDGSAYCDKLILGTGWLTHYGQSDWPSRSYMLVPLQDFNRGPE